MLTVIALGAAIIVADHMRDKTGVWVYCVAEIVLLLVLVCFAWPDLWYTLDLLLEAVNYLWGN